MKKVAILQSNYIPWKGYFDIIASVDEFIIFDDAQYTKNDWRNRNQIKTPLGSQWLTIPIKHHSKQRIKEVKINNIEWARHHWKTLQQNYGSADYFNEISTWLKPLYLQNNDILLSAVNRHFIEAICHYLDIKTCLSNSWDYHLVEGKTEKLVSLCQQVNATEYISGPLAKNYINSNLFIAENIKLTYFDYQNYQSYPQRGEFTHNVSILDLLFNCGKNSKKYMKCNKEQYHG